MPTIEGEQEKWVTGLLLERQALNLLVQKEIEGSGGLLAQGVNPVELKSKECNCRK